MALPFKVFEFGLRKAVIVVQGARECLCVPIKVVGLRADAC